MEELQRKVASRRGHRAHLTKLNHKMEDIMAAELDAVQRATIAIHIEQLEQKRQKLSQLDTEIADPIEKPEDLKEEILESEELQCTIAVGRACGKKLTTPQWSHHNTTFTECHGTSRTIHQYNSRNTAATICRIRKQLSLARSNTEFKHGEYEFKFKYSSKC